MKAIETITGSVSVLIPARNEERVIGATLASLLASRGVEIEVVVLDDGSTDRTAEVVRGFAVQDARVRLRSSAPLRYASGPRVPTGRLRRP